MKRFCVALFALAFILLTSGCGQSGPLYLPEDPSRIETVPPTPEDSEEETEEDGEAPKQQS